MGWDRELNKGEHGKTALNDLQSIPELIRGSPIWFLVALSFLAKGYLILPIIIPFKILIFLFLFDGAVAGGS